MLRYRELRDKLNSFTEEDLDKPVILEKYEYKVAERYEDCKSFEYLDTDSISISDIVNEYVYCCCNNDDPYFQPIIKTCCSNGLCIIKD